MTSKQHIKLFESRQLQRYIHGVQSIAVADAAAPSVLKDSLTPHLLPRSQPFVLMGAASSRSSTPCLYSNHPFNFEISKMNASLVLAERTDVLLADLSSALAALSDSPSHAADKIVLVVATEFSTLLPCCGQSLGRMRFANRLFWQFG